MRKELIELYRRAGIASFFDRFFIKARMKMLPLEKLDALVPRRGTIVEIGCGHGLIANYLALSSPERTVIGVDIDGRRVEMARSTAAGRSNIEFRRGFFQDFAFRDLDMVILFGVLCLIPYGEWPDLFAAIHGSLRHGGTLLLHDVKKTKTFGYWIHEKKEDLFRILGITEGKGFFVKKPEDLEVFLRASRFSLRETALDVPYHSCLNYLLTKA